MVKISKEVGEVKDVLEVKELMKNNIKIHQTTIEIENLRNKLTNIMEKEDAMKNLVSRVLKSQEV